MAQLQALIRGDKTWTSRPLCWRTVEAICRRAGDAILEVYGSDFEVKGKADASPVTAADERAEALITPALAAPHARHPIVAEEAVAGGAPPDVSGGRFWLVDPLDGTKEFISRNGEFTVNIALVEQGVPVLAWCWRRRSGGSIPAHAAWVPGSKTSTAAMPSTAARCQRRAWPWWPAARMAMRRRSTPSWPAARSRSWSARARRSLCLVSPGQADLYPRLGRTMEWDIAAGDAVLRAAGGLVRCVSSHEPLRYGKPGLDNPHFYAAA